MDLANIPFPLRRPDGSFLGMTTVQEQDWCRNYAARRHTGAGALVELGCFFGSLTIPFAEGLRAATEAGRLAAAAAVVESFDLFYWHRSMFVAIENSPLQGRLTEGEWFIDVFKANTAHVAPLVNVHWEDLGKRQWAGGPIELLLLDCLKYDEITNNVLRSFFPATRPGLSRIAHQDYFHFYEWWTHVLTYEQRDLLAVEEALPHSGMLVLKVVGDLAAHCAAADPHRDFSKTPPDLIEAAYDWNYALLHPDYHDALTAGRIWAHLQTGQMESAQRLYADTRARFGASPAYADLLGYCAGQGIPFAPQV